MDSSALEVLWQDPERVFCRQTTQGSELQRHFFMPGEVGAAHPTIESITRLTRECALKDLLDRAWAVRPLELVRDGGRTMLVVDYSGGAARSTHG